MMDKHIEVKSTPAANWRQEGKTDPHNTRYECQRVDLTMGQLTDDEIANAVFLCDHRTSFDSIVYLTAAKDRIRWLSRSNEALIAQLEAAQKERDALREVNIGAGSNTRAAADIYFQLVDELEVPAGGSLVGVIDNLKAELSVANAKLSKPVVLPDDGLEDCINMWPDNWRNDFDTGYNFGIWRCEQNIKAAGFIVEGE
ncbi:TPA: hypothetical protein ACQTCB_000038 [Yersinia enterocolitica]